MEAELVKLAKEKELVEEGLAKLSLTGSTKEVEEQEEQEEQSKKDKA